MTYLWRIGFPYTAVIFFGAAVQAAGLPDAGKIEAKKLLDVDHYCEGVVFDHDGKGYLSQGEQIVQFTLDGKPKVWAEGYSPNGHKILADGTHLVCDAKRNVILHFAADGKALKPAAEACEGKPLRGPNDLTLDTPHAGFYFTDPGDSGKDNPVGTVDYVDSRGAVNRVADGLAYPNGIVLRPDGTTLLVGESQKNRILVYDVISPGKVGKQRVFADLPEKDTSLGQIDNQPDGMCLDADGNLYVAHYGMRQVQVLDPSGKLIARYPGGNVTTSNVAFGGPKMDQLFVTGGEGGEENKGGLYRLDLGVKGLTILPPKKK